MKARYALPLFAALLFTAADSHAIRLGDLREDVVGEMGRPSGEIGSGELVVLFYDRGEVHLRNGEVSAINLVTAEELAARKIAEAEELERIRVAEAARRARLEAEGLALFSKKKSDFTFQTLPAAEQLRFWRWFSSQYPMVPIDEELRAALAKYEQQQRLREIEFANNQRISELEQQVEDAERRAEQAENRRSYGYGYGYGYPYYYANRPIYRPRPHHGGGDGGRDHDYKRGRDSRRQSTGITTSTDLRSRAMSGIEAARDAAYRSVSGPQGNSGD